jgi:cytochrome P450
MARAVWYVPNQQIPSPNRRLVIPGPIVRISPDELHIDDPEYYDELYGSQTKKRDKYAPWVQLSGIPGSIFSTVPHDLHRLRRSALNPLFSKQAVTKFEDVIQQKVSRLAGRFEKASRTGEVIRADAALTALTTDVICNYMFAADEDYLMHDDFKLAWKKCLDVGFEAGAFLRQFPSMGAFFKSLHMTVLAKLNPPLHMLMDMRLGIDRRVDLFLQRKSDKKIPDGGDGGRQTLFETLLDHPDLPEHERTKERLLDEIRILTGAGSETTGQTLAWIMFYLLSDPVKLQVSLHTRLELSR